MAYDYRFIKVTDNTMGQLNNLLHVSASRTLWANLLISQ